MFNPKQSTSSSTGCWVYEKSSSRWCSPNLQKIRMSIGHCFSLMHTHKIQICVHINIHTKTNTDEYCIRVIAQEALFQASSFYYMILVQDQTKLRSRADCVLHLQPASTSQKDGEQEKEENFCMCVPSGGHTRWSLSLSLSLAHKHTPIRSCHTNACSCSLSSANDGLTHSQHAHTLTHRKTVPINCLVLNAPARGRTHHGRATRYSRRNAAVHRPPTAHESCATAPAMVQVSRSIFAREQIEHGGQITKYKTLTFRIHGCLPVGQIHVHRAEGHEHHTRPSSRALPLGVEAVRCASAAEEAQLRHERGPRDCPPAAAPPRARSVPCRDYDLEFAHPSAQATFAHPSAQATFDDPP